MKKTINFRFDERVLEVLARLAEALGTTRTKVVEEGVYLLAEKHGVKADE